MDYMSDEEIACLRLSADVFVHAQVSDALCTTIQEYLYTGAIVLNPDWIQYSDLRENRIAYIEYVCFDQIPDVVGTILKTRETEELPNRAVLIDMSSWNMVAPQLAKLYE